MEVLPRSEPTCGQEWTWYRAYPPVHDWHLRMTCRRWRAPEDLHTDIAVEQHALHVAEVLEKVR